MDDFNSFWRLLGENSGQLQTLLGFVAIILAIIAALFAKKQIIMANNQRFAELKLSTFDACLSLQELVHETRHKHEIYDEHCEKMLLVKGLTLDDIVEGFNYNYREYLTFPLKLLKSPENLANTIIEELSSKKNIDQSDLEMYLETLILGKGKIHTVSKGYDRNITNIDKGIDKAIRFRESFGNHMSSPARQ